MNNKILMYFNLIPPDYGGSYLRLYRLASRLNKNGLLFKIITYTSKKSYEDFKEKIIYQDKIIFLRYKIQAIINVFFLFLTNHKSFSSVYVVSIQWHSFPLILFAKIFKKKVLIGVTLSMSDSPASRSNNFFINTYYKAKNLQFKLSDKIIVNSPLLYHECLSAGIDKEKLEMIPNPVDRNVFYPLSKESKKDKKIKLSMSEDINLLFVGVLAKRKGLDTLIKICNYLSKLDLKFCMNIIGDELNSESDFEFVNQVKDHIIDFNNINNSQINLLGVKTNVNEYIQASDFFVFPSRNEGLPNVVIEAMASGIPIVCSDLKGITNYLLESEFLISSENVEGFAKTIYNTLKDSNKLNSQVNRNLKFVEENLGVDKNLNRFKTLI